MRVLKVFHAVVVVLVSDLFEEEKNKSLWNNRDFTWHATDLPGVEVFDNFRLIRSFNMSEQGDAFRAISGEFRLSCFCFNRDRSFKFGSDT